MTEKQDKTISKPSIIRYEEIDGKQVPVLPAESVTTIRNKRTGRVYESTEAFNTDVADGNTDTIDDDFQQDVVITVAQLSLLKGDVNLEEE